MSIVYSRGALLKLGKNIQRTESINEPTENKVPLFRLNSIANDLGTKEEGKDPKRQQWDSPIEFLLSFISMSVGLGNVWRFPFTAYEPFLYNTIFKFWLLVVLCTLLS
jgi:hypothetical protein